MSLLALLPWHDALAAIGKGTDVYLFLTGMMLLAELARREGLFDWLAVYAAEAAKGSPARLFSLVYIVGIAVTSFLSNDATAVVLTPAVYAAAKAAEAKPLPYLFICALIANAASFVLPISNPANLVIYNNHMPRFSRGFGNSHCRRCLQLRRHTPRFGGSTVMSSKGDRNEHRSSAAIKRGTVYGLWYWICSRRSSAGICL